MSQEQKDNRTREILSYLTPSSPDKIQSLIVKYCNICNFFKSKLLELNDINEIKEIEKVILNLSFLYQNAQNECKSEPNKMFSYIKDKLENEYYFYILNCISHSETFYSIYLTHINGLRNLIKLLHEK